MSKKPKEDNRVLTKYSIVVDSQQEDRLKYDRSKEYWKAFYGFLCFVIVLWTAYRIVVQFF